MLTDNRSISESIRDAIGQTVNRVTTSIKDKVSSTMTSTANPPEIIVNSDTSTPTSDDWRVRISLANPDIYADSPFIRLLYERTNGVIFPYTPNVTISHVARYSEQALTHSNYKQFFYDGSEVSNININAEFTVQNHDDGRYLLSVIYFFRTVTKMFYGNDQYAGTPPPLVFLNGYGDFYFPNVSCVVARFEHVMPENVDYMEIPFSAGSIADGKAPGATNQVVRLPLSSQISVTLNPVYSRKNMYENFSVTDFSQGKLLKGNGGFI